MMSSSSSCCCCCKFGSSTASVLLLLLCFAIKLLKCLHASLLLHSVLLLLLVRGSKLSLNGPTLTLLLLVGTGGRGRSWWLPGKLNVEVGDSRDSSVDSIMAYMLCILLLSLVVVDDGNLEEEDDHELCHALRTSRQGGSEGWWERGVILLRTRRAGCTVDPSCFWS